MQFQIKQKIGARFKLIARKANNGSIARESEWFSNIVLNTGLNRMSVGRWIDRCCIGAGNSTPLATQTALDNFLASTTKIQASTGSRQVTIEPYYYSATVTWRFGEGVAAGNLSEVGLGWGDTNLWNRALIRDVNGNPTTMTILSDEFLDVISEIRVYPERKIEGTFNLLDKSGSIKSVHNYVAYPAIIADGTAGFSLVCFPRLPYGYTYPSTQGINNSPVDNPGGGLVSWDGYTQELSNPTPTSSRCKITYNLQQANGTHKSFSLPIEGLLAATSMNRVKVEIDPPITKTNLQVMTYTFELSWGRYEGNN